MRKRPLHRRGSWVPAAVLAGWLGVPILLSAAAAAPAGRDAPASLEVFPQTIRLDSSRDRQRIIVRTRAADGRTSDVTAAAEVAVSDPRLATVDRSSRALIIRPLADGEATVRVTAGELSREVPLHVVSASSEPVLSFRMDVMPVFARGGCNMGSCHGAARGKDGFRLSLFGFDPEGDHHRLTREFPGRRIDLGSPRESLLFLKATGGVPHTGGRRFPADGELADTLERWIAAGAPDDPGPDPGESVPRLVALDLYPPESLLAGEAVAQPLVAVARFSDGTDRDVTDLAWYGTNNDRVAMVSPEGLVTGGGRGEAFVMARYATMTVGVPFISIPADAAPADGTADLGADDPGATPGSRAIDELVAAKLASLRIAPAPVCDDQTFLRRATLDLVGLLPTPAERDDFLADGAADKRRRLVDRLMARREFTDLWVMQWAELLQIRSTGNEVSPKAALLYHQWLDRRISANEPLDVMVRDLLTASGGSFENPATNYFLLERNTLKVAENVAQAFLGMRIQCAQCHNHPFDRWTMDDYYGFSAFFAQIGRKRAADPRETIVFDAGGGEVQHPVRRKSAPPKFLGGDVAKVADRDRREALAEWITAADNPFFARHVANVVWTHFFGRGIVHEPDDARVSNPPANGPLYDELGRRLVASGWDFRSLVRDIVQSRTYQRSCETNESNRHDERNFSHAAVRRPRAEVLLDVLAQVTDTQNRFPGMPAGTRAVQVADGRTTNYFLTTFGRATRQDACSCAVRMDPSLSQALHLLNGDAANERIRQGRVVERMLARGMPATRIIDELFVRCDCRMPTERERIETLAVVLAAKDKKQALEDVFWALLNSPEFIFNH